ncbi:hypothetical protein OF83DRAFT_814041 [Amylostereum chailletii]|nr:hypothetical protein OF83DRAFT_814041 [Amylostereum chailletii]
MTARIQACPLLCILRPLLFLIPALLFKCFSAIISAGSSNADVLHWPSKCTNSESVRHSRRKTSNLQSLTHTHVLHVAPSRRGKTGQIACWSALQNRRGPFSASDSFTRTSRCEFRPASFLSLRLIWWHHLFWRRLQS